MKRVRTVFRNEEIPGRIHALQPFLSVGKLPDGTRVWSGHSGGPVTFGHLPRKYHDSVRDAVYVVYSYDTPIAWVWERSVGTDPYFYVLPDVSYSPSTGQHQYAVRDAWSTALRRQGTFPLLGHGRAGRGRDVVRVPGNAELYGRERRLRSGGIDGARPGHVVTRETREINQEAEEHGGYEQGPPARDFSGYPSHP